MFVFVCSVCLTTVLVLATPPDVMTLVWALNKAWYKLYNFSYRILSIICADTDCTIK